MGVKLIVLRHGEREWSLSNQLTGWTDVTLSEGGIQEARRAGHLLRATPHFEPRCAHLRPGELPAAGSPKDTLGRVLPASRTIRGGQSVENT